MSGWWDRVRQLWRQLWRKQKPAIATPAAPSFEPPPATPAPVPAAATPAAEPITATASVMPPRDALSEREKKIHALELARLRHDKWVKPKGERPKRERVPRPPKPTPAPITKEDDEPIPVGDHVDDHVSDGRVYAADEWMEGDGQGKVLFLEEEFYGEFNFRDSILDQLDRYWVYLERMRKHDFGAYIMCRKIGATLVPYSTTFSNRLHGKKDDREPVEEYKQGIALPPWFKQCWPAFGCVAVGTNPLDEAQELKPKDESGKTLWVTKFMHVLKLAKTPWFVQPTRGGHIYEMTLYWDRPHDPKYQKRRKWGVPQNYYIWVADDGSTMRVLKTRRDGDQFTPDGKWILNHDLDPEDTKQGYTPQIVLSRKFCDIAKMLEQSSFAMCRVEVSKGDMAATFGVDPRRMSYFFRDRDINLTVDGVTKRIFHIVRPHQRADGSFVPMHFRGLKQFTWAGYNVSITVPGLDHLPLFEWNVGALLVPTKERLRFPKKDYIDETEVAERVKNSIKHGLGAYRR